MAGCDCNAFHVVDLDGCYSVQSCRLGQFRIRIWYLGRLMRFIHFTGQPAELSQACWVMICSSWRSKIWFWVYILQSTYVFIFVLFVYCPITSNQMWIYWGTDSFLSLPTGPDRSLCNLLVMTEIDILFIYKKKQRNYKDKRNSQKKKKTKEINKEALGSWGRNDVILVIWTVRYEEHIPDKACNCLITLLKGQNSA